LENLNEVVQWVRAELAQVLDRPIEEIDSKQNFSRLGVDSATATHLMIALEDVLQVELDPDVVDRLFTIESLAAYAFNLTRGQEWKPQ
jgi:acyl carrier protein